jgi:isocitrate lyase
MPVKAYALSTHATLPCACAFTVAALNFSTFRLAKDYAARGMAAYAELQAAEFAAEVEGYRATSHQVRVPCAVACASLPSMRVAYAEAPPPC